MRILLILLLLVSFSKISFANPAFGDKKLQVMLSAGPSFRSGRTESKLKYTHVNLGFADSFLGINTRDSLEAGYMFGIDRYKQTLFGASRELIFGNDSLYLTLGLGAYLKKKKTDRGGSHFTFGERIGIGRRIGHTSFEIFARHFSNAGLSSKNAGQNFTGLSVGYNF